MVLFEAFAILRPKAVSFPPFLRNTISHRISAACIYPEKWRVQSATKGYLTIVLHHVYTLQIECFGTCHHITLPKESKNEHGHPIGSPGISRWKILQKQCFTWFVVDLSIDSWNCRQGHLRDHTFVAQKGKGGDLTGLLCFLFFEIGSQPYNQQPVRRFTSTVS